MTTAPVLFRCSEQELSRPLRNSPSLIVNFMRFEPCKHILNHNLWFPEVCGLYCFCGIWEKLLWCFLLKLPLIFFLGFILFFIFILFFFVGGSWKEYLSYPKELIFPSGVLLCGSSWSVLTSVPVLNTYEKQWPIFPICNLMTLQDVTSPCLAFPLSVYCLCFNTIPSCYSAFFRK